MNDRIAAKLKDLPDTPGVYIMRDIMREHGLPDSVKSGIFGADMVIEQSNIGPVTIIY